MKKYYSRYDRLRDRMQFHTIGDKAIHTYRNDLFLGGIFGTWKAKASHSDSFKLSADSTITRLDVLYEDERNYGNITIDHEQDFYIHNDILEFAEEVKKQIRRCQRERNILSPD